MVDMLEDSSITMVFLPDGGTVAKQFKQSGEVGLAKEWAFRVGGNH